MIDKIKYAARLSLIGGGSFLKLFVLGTFSAAFTFVLGLVLLGYGSQLNTGHAPAEFFLVALAKAYPIQSVLLVLIVVSNYLLFGISTKYAVKKVASKIVNDNAETALYPLMDKALDKAIGNISEDEKRNMIQKGFDFSMVQVKAVDNIKNETENKWVRRLLVYGFEKLSIDDIPFNDPNLNIRDVVKTKVIGFIKEIAEPSKGIYWYLILYHWVVLGIIIFTR